VSLIAWLPGAWKSGAWAEGTWGADDEAQQPEIPRRYRMGSGVGFKVPTAPVIKPIEEEEALLLCLM
jgi:hypothetical protein